MKVNLKLKNRKKTAMRKEERWCVKSKRLAKKQS